jgi:hypothetical protein
MSKDRGMGVVVRITCFGRYGSTISEIAPLQQDILNAFSLQMDS